VQFLEVSAYSGDEALTVRYPWEALLLHDSCSLRPILKLTEKHYYFYMCYYWCTGNSL
jgi:hypothetical protein